MNTVFPFYDSHVSFFRPAQPNFCVFPCPLEALLAILDAVVVLAHPSWRCVLPFPQPHLDVHGALCILNPTSENSEERIGAR